MSLFAITPRLADEYDFLDELLGRRIRYNPRDLQALRGASNLAQLVPSLRESEVQNTDKELRIHLRLPHFTPEEVKITSDNKRVTVTAKHEEKEDKHGYVSREMTRVYTLPKDVDPKSVTSTMDPHGNLSIRVAKQEQPAAVREVNIPVEYKG